MPQTTPSAMRVVPSGQTYRQLFDAQFQLSQSLSHFDLDSRGQHGQAHKSSHVASLPIIRLSQDEMKHGILTSRQKSWVTGLPNDPYTENPVLYKQYSDFLNQELQETNVSQAQKEVINLPDIVVAAKKESDILDRVVQSKKQRHEAVLDDMHKTLTFISMKMERVIEELSTVFQNKLARNDDEIESLLASIEDDENLKTCKMEVINALWENIEGHAKRRQQWIASLHSDLQNLEISRFNQTREVFTTFGKKLQQISFLMLPDLQRLLDRESQKVNQAVLSNYRTYADLCMRLKSVDIEREKIQHTTWLKKIEDWRILNTRVSVEEFKEFMKTDAVVSPSGAETVKANLHSDLKVITSQRLELLRTLCDMQPPNATRLAVQKWYKDLKKLCEEIDNVVNMHLSKLHEEYELVCKLCLDKVDSIKMMMLEKGICSSHTASQVIDEFMLPLVGKQQRVFEQGLDNLQKMTEGHVDKVKDEISALYKFAKGAAYLWDMHESNLAKKEREMHEEVARTKIEQTQLSQEQEAQLDSDLDRMRQDGNEIALKENLVRALNFLERIKESYETTHKLQIRAVQNYPEVINEELNRFDEAVCNYFSVSRMDIPIDLMSALMPDEYIIEMAEEETEDTEVKENTTDKTQNQFESRVSETPSAKKERIVTSNGTVFYLLHKEVDRKSLIKIRKERNDDAFEVSQVTPDDQTFLTEVTELKADSECETDSSTDSLAEFVEVIDISDEVFSKIRDAIRMNFLEHLDNWSQQALVRANTVVVTKSEELNGELDLRLHLHQPRPRRIELDIHNVRAAELVLHAERITRHCSGVDKSLAELRSKFKALSVEHIKMAHAFEEYIDSLEEILLKATKSTRLVKLQNQVAIELDQFMSSIRASLRQFRQHMDETLLKLRGSNAKFIKSFRLFSDGGNFCPEEIEIYRKKLDLMSLLIDSAEGSIMSELESVESKILDSATKTASSFEDRFKSHMSDLIFMECIVHGLTNVQVKIKAEVAKSNAQAQKIAQMLKELQEKLSTCGNTSPDKGPLTASQLNDALFEIFKTVFKRNRYLHCRNASKMFRDETPTAAKDTQPLDEKTTRPSVSSSSGIIKSIFKCLEMSKIMSDEDGAQAKAKEIEFTMKPAADGVTSDLENSKLQFQESNKAMTYRKYSQQSGSDAIKEESIRKASSGKTGKTDQKMTPILEMVEGFEEEKGDYFLQIISHAVKESLDGLVTTAEVYYNQKGSRQITRPQAIPETCDQCADIFLFKVQSYYSQTEAYHNQCLKDFQEQLTQLEQLCASIPEVIIAGLATTQITQAKDVQVKLTEGFHAKLSYLDETQKSLEKELRLTLGHPQHTKEMAELCAKEKKWFEEFTELVTQHVQERQEHALGNAKVFLEKLVETSEQQLLLFDKMLVANETPKGKSEPNPQSTYELIRHMKSGQTLENKIDTSKQDHVSQGSRAMWTGLPSNKFFIGEKPSTLEITASVETCKSTLAHSASVEARNKAFEDYKKYFEETLQEIEVMKERLFTSQKNWDKSWESSVKKVISLYQKEE